MSSELISPDGTRTTRSGILPDGDGGAAKAVLDGRISGGPAGRPVDSAPALDGAAIPLVKGLPDDIPVTPLTSADARELAAQFAVVARALEAQTSVEATLRRVVDVAVAIVPGCHHAGITVLRRGRPETPAATDEVSGQVDAVQYETGEGPCLSAIVEHDTFRTGDLAAEIRWPKFSGPAVERTGVHSVLAYRLFTAEDTFGALNLYSRERDAFDDDALAVGTILAAHAALACARAREREQITGLEQAVASNRAIGMAIGILMAIRRVSQQEAFDLLRVTSQRANRKLREIADEVVLTGELPPG
jgi:GAF domain-containing protein